MKKRKNFKLLALLLCLAALVCALVVTVFAEGTDKEDATVAIEAAFADKKVGTTVTISDDGYIGIPVKVSTYYDYAKHGAAKPGYNATIAVMYVVNTQIERIGTKTDVEIIQSMLDRGYIVSVFDYMNNGKAVSPGLDWSTQMLRKNFLSGSYFNDTTKVPKGTYNSNFVVPAGYDVSYGNVFWETDKHAADGSLEKIVENWNTDLKHWNNIKDKTVYWRNALGEQKKTEAGAEWYSDSAAKNKVDASASNANYTKVKYTIAEDVTDCVGPDGTPIDLNLYMHIVYPTTTEANPIDPVPVAVLASSTEYLSTASTGSGMRPQHNGFLFNGYAGATFDYLYQPMAQSDYWGYYDGQTVQGAITGDRMNYGLHLYNDKKINTAAMRFIRYLTYTEGDTYVFDDTSIGVFGNSKGGWFTFLGEAEVREYTVEDASLYTKAELEALINARINAYTSKRQFQGHRSETRYDNGITADYTKNGVTIDGGELQPWLTYTDKDGNVKEILGYASWIYASNGAQYEDITEGHAPVFSALHLQDDFTTTHNLFSEVTLGLDIPSMYVIVDLGHTFAYGPDYYLGYDTYQAMFDFANYYLKGDAVKVVYTNPASNTGAMATTTPITVKFSGAVAASEVEKITLTAGGVAVNGTWTSVRGNTEWTFEHEALLPGTAYTLTVPASLAGDNGKAMGEAYTATYYTESESVYGVEKTNASNGAYFTVTVPENATASDAVIRFYVSNDAANVAELYTVSGFDASNPSSAVKGELVSSVSLKGAGYYEVDVTKYVLEANAGDKLTFLLSEKKTAGVSTGGVSFASSLSSVTLGSYVRGSIATAPDGTSAAKVYVTANIRASGSLQYPNELPFYANATTAITYKNIFGSAFTESDLGRQFRITIRLYDTDTRIVQLDIGRVKGDMVHDKNNMTYNFMTTPGEWQEYSFDYTVYDMEYGDAGLTAKNLTVMLGSCGCDESPIYISGITVEETVTNVTLGDADLVLGERGDAYKKNGTTGAVSIGTVSYETIRSALASAKSGDTIKLNKNYTFTTADDTTAWASLGNITLDLNGYNLYSDSSLPIIHAPATSKVTASVTVKNGSVYLSDGALIGYNGSNATGNGKVINLNLENVNLYNAKESSVTDFISASAIESTSGAEVKISLNNVNIDYRKANNTKNPVKILSNGAASLNVNYTVKGGSITLDGVSGVTIFDTFRKTEFAKNTSGNYTSLYVPSGITIPTLAVTVGNTLMTYAKASESLGVTKYSVQASEYATKFGFIPEEYGDAERYPFVMFDENGNFKGAYSYWLGQSGSGSVIAAAKGYVVNAWNGTTYGDNPKEAYIVLRRNYTYEVAEGYDNLAQVQGTIHVDLGGYTLSTSTYAKPILAADSKGYSGAAGNKIYPTTVNFYNGKLMHGRSGIVSMKTWDSVGDGSIVNKDFTFNFTNVTFGFVDGADSVGLLAHALAPTTKTVAAPFYFNYYDCTFDVRTTKSQHNSAQLFNTNTADKYIKVTHTVYGGTIIADNPAKITIVPTATDNYGSAVIFAKGSDGNYTAFRTLTSAAAPSGSYKSDIGDNLIFKATKTDGNDTVYMLDASDLATAYGVITDTYADKEAYPFAVFKSDGTFVRGYASFGKAIEGAKAQIAVNVWDPVNKTYGSNPLSAIVLVRRDYTTNATDNTFNDMAQAQGEILIDLGGYTITQGAEDKEGIFGEAKAKGWGGSGDEKVFPSTYTIINGSFKVLSKSLFVMSIWETVGDGAVGEKLFTFNMKNVNVGYASGATALNLLVTYAGSSASSGCKVSKPAQFFMNLEDCTFDLKTNGPNNPKLFNASNTQWVKNTITVKGGSIIAKTLTKDMLYAVENVYGSSVSFAKDADGNYTTLTIDSTGTVPTEELPGANGAVVNFAKESATLYSLSTIITKYGVIPEKFANTTSYPLAVFQNGWFVGAYNVFADGGNTTGALAKAKELTDGSVASEIGTQVEILFRADASATNTFPNVGQILGTIVIDLNGKTFTQGYNSKSLFGSEAKNWKGTDDAIFKVFNGNIVLQTSLLTYDGFGDSYNNGEGDKTFKFEFDNVNISYKSNAKPTALLGVFGERMTGGKKVYYEVSLTNCVFDLTNAASINTIFNANDPDTTLTNAIVKVDIKGGNVIFANADPELYSVNAANGSLVTFSKNDGGSYVTFTLPGGAKNPNFVANGGALETVKIAEGTTTVVYTFAPVTISSYIPKMSITLSNALIMNVYIPVNGTESFTLDTKTYGECEIVTLDDGRDYYLVPVALGSSEGARELVLNVTVKFDGVTSNAVFTFSIPKYVTKVLDNENELDATKTLARDVLAYVKEAYNYSGFAAHNTAEEIARVNALINSIIGADYTHANETTGVTNKADGVSMVTLNLDAKPSIRFYVTDSTVEFYLGTRKLDTVSGKDANGDYIELDVNAYVLSETITYANGGSYHISSFIAGAGEAELALVKAFVRYTESAAAYRNAVIGK